MKLRRINRIQIIFLAFVSIAIWGTRRFLESERFSRFLTEKIASTIQNKIPLGIDFSHVEIDFWSRSSALKDVKINYKDQDLNLSVTLEKLDFKFSVLDFFEKELTISEINPQNGSLYINFSEQKDSSNFKIEDLNYETINSFETFLNKKVPVKFKKLKIENINFSFNKTSFYVENFSFGIYSSFYDLEIYLEKVLLKEKKIGNFFLDSIDLKIEVSKDDFRINKGNIYDKLNQIHVEDVRLKNGKIKGEFSYQGDFSKFEKYLPLEIKNLAKNYWEARIFYPDYTSLENPHFEINAYDTSCDYFNLEKVFILGKIDQGDLFLKKVVAENKDEKIFLVKEEKLLNIRKEKFYENKFFLNFKNVHTNTALYFLKDILNPMKGSLSGDLSIQWNGRDLVFDFYENSVLKKFSLDFETNILKNEGFKLHNSQILVDVISGDVTLNMNLNLGYSKFVSSGVIRSKDIDLKISKTAIDFEEFGPISGVDVFGKGLFELEIKGEMENVFFNFDFDISDLSLLDINLGKAKGKATLKLKDLELNLDRIRGKVAKNSLYEVDGSFYFSEKVSNNIDLKINLEQSNYDDFFDILRFLKKDLDANIKFLDSLKMNYGAIVRLSGGLSFEKMVIEGDISGDYFSYLKEEFSEFKSDFKIAKSKISVNEFEIKKGDGIIAVGLDYDFVEKKVDYKLNVSKIRLSDFYLYNTLSLGLDGRFDGNIEGGRKKINQWWHSGFLNFSQTTVGFKKVKDSKIVLSEEDGSLGIKGSFLGKSISFSSLLNFIDQTESKKSRMELIIDMEDISIFWGILSSHNIVNESNYGDLKGRLISDFSIKDWAHLDLNFFLDSFNFRYQNRKYSLSENKKKIIVKNGKINFWEIMFSNFDEYILTQGEGDISKDFKIYQDFELDLGLVKLLTPKLLDARGVIVGEGLIEGNKKNINNSYKVKGKNGSFKLEGIPGLFSNVEFELDLENKDFYIKNTKMDFGRGRIRVDGKVAFKIPFPEVELNLKVNESFIPFYEKSNMVISSDLNLYGYSLPYSLSGNINVLQLNFFDEFAKISEGKARETYQKFMPQRSDIDKVDYFKNDIEIDFLSPVVIKNNLADIALVGKATLYGGPMTPKLEGYFNVSNSKSKFIFKGLDFFLSEGTVNFSEESELTRPEYKFKSQTSIGQYKIDLDFWGEGDNVAMNLSSDPPLSKRDIFSLLTIGITEDSSKKLESEERNSMATMGLGNFIVDQFQINRELGNTLGLKLSLLSDVEENEVPLEGRTSQTLKSKAKSSTKIKIQKELLKDVDLSISSTIGDDPEKKQEMNIQYKINNNLSVEGVYEKTIEEDTEDDSKSSLGLDFKYRKSFK